MLKEMIPEISETAHGKKPLIPWEMNNYSSIYTNRTLDDLLRKKQKPPIWVMETIL